ncbi:MAG: hypothetical protein E6K54_09000 [Gammaproteobacteria bacterium]|nr:MAG: hypothetical protein E6K54_09000 [Gammaproteobacteria bacterium]
MKKIYLFLSVILLGYSAFSQTEVSLSDIAKHEGDSVVVKGSIFGTRYLVTAKGSPTFMNVGAKYPNDSLTLVIWGNDRSKFQGDPEKTYLNKTVQVSGKVEIYKGKPEIILYSDKQMMILSN